MRTLLLRGVSELIVDDGHRLKIKEEWVVGVSAKILLGLS
jgi:hypothetical protein